MCCTSPILLILRPYPLAHRLKGASDEQNVDPSTQEQPSCFGDVIISGLEMGNTLGRKRLADPSSCLCFGIGWVFFLVLNDRMYAMFSRVSECSRGPKPGLGPVGHLAVVSLVSWSCWPLPGHDQPASDQRASCRQPQRLTKQAGQDRG